MRHEGVGAAAPPLELPTAAGDQRSLSEFRGKPTIVTFLGPANCTFCRSHVIRLVQAHDEIARRGAEVLLVAPHDPELMTAKMLRSIDVPYVMLLDPTRASFARWGLVDHGLALYFDPKMYWAVLRAGLRGERYLGYVKGGRQLGGDFVVNRQGALTFVNRMHSFYDRPKVADLMAAVERG